MPDSWPITSIIMAKLPEAGAVKTRLVEDGYAPQAAAALSQAMLSCIADRLQRRGAIVLAVTPDGAGERLRGMLGRATGKAVRIIDQGTGDLGRRMARVWPAVAADRPAAFFGIDSPDVPEPLLDEIPRALERADAAIGPTDDGGIWTLAARQPLPELLASVDWGTDRVYDQIRQRAENAGIALALLSGWKDIDRGKDVGALAQRLAAMETGGEDVDPALHALHRAVARLMPPLDQ